MKNLIKILIIFLIFISLNSCGKTNDTQKKVSENKEKIKTTDNIKEEKINSSTGSQKAVLDDWDEYSFKLSVKNNLGMENTSKYYKKGDNQLIIIEKLIAPELEKMPLKIQKMLSVNKNIYQKMTIKGKEYRTKTSASQIGGQTSFFNLKEVSKVPKEQIKETKEETINGKNMTCYYFDDKSGKGKGCLYKGIFMYGENTGENGEQTTMIISDYNEKVDNNVFNIPKEEEITSMEEMSKIMQEIIPQQNIAPQQKMNSKTEENQETKK